MAQDSEHLVSGRGYSRGVASYSEALFHRNPTQLARYSGNVGMNKKRIPLPKLPGLVCAAVLICASLPAAAQAPPDSTDPDSTAYELDPLVVTATRLGTTTDLLAVSVNLVGRAEVRDQPNRLLLDALAAEPGVLVQQTTAGQGAAFVRALTGSQVLLMVDGVRLNNGTFRQGPSQYLSSVDPEIMERMEVVRGASSTLYGSDAMGGVINVITRRAADVLDPGQRWVAEGSYTFDGATDGSRVRASTAAAFPDFMSGLEFLGGGSVASWSHLQPGGGLPHQDPTSYDQWSGDFRLDLQATQRLRVEMAAQHSEQSNVPRYDRYVDFRAPGLPGGGVGRNALYLFEPQDRSLARLKGTLATDRPWMSTLDVQMSWQVQREGRAIRGQSMREGILTPSARINHVADDVRSVALDVQAQAIRGDGRGGVTYGLEMWDNVTRSHGWEEDLVTGAETSSFRWSSGEPISTGRFPDGSRFGGAALYAFADEAWGALRIQVGGRASLYRTSARVGDSYGGDVDSRFGNVTGEAGFVYRASEAVSLRARVAQAFRAPNIYDLTLVGDVPGGIALPNPDLGPEHSYTLETGANWARGPWRTELTVFRIGINDLLDRTYGTFQGRSTHGPDQLPILTIQNIGSAIIDGIEGTFSAPLPARGRLHMSASWTLGDAVVARDGVLQEEPLSRVPPATLSYRMRWPASRDERSAWIEYFGKMSAAQDRLGFRDQVDSRVQDGGTPGYHVHSIRGGASWSDHLRVSGGIENLFDKLFRVHGSGIDAPGRHLFLRLDVRR